MKPFRKGGLRRKKDKGQIPDQHRINENIRSSEVRVISESGEQLGIQPIAEALRIAEDAGYDLVEVSPNAEPPVCKLMDYGKFKYREQKKQAEARKKRSEIVTKEIRIRYRTDTADLETKLKKAREFLKEGDKVKFSMRFKGREIVYTDLGLDRLDEIADSLSDVAEVDDRSPTIGRQIYITFAPIKG